MHRLIEKKVLGRTYPRVHNIMDSTAGIRNGPSHRRDMVHNPLFIYAMTGDYGAFQAAILHTILDDTVSGIKKQTKNKAMRAMLEAM